MLYKCSILLLLASQVLITVVCCFVLPCLSTSTTTIHKRRFNSKNWVLMHPHSNIESFTLSLPFTLTFVVAPSYIAHITDTIHSSTPSYLVAHQTTFWGTLLNAFSRSSKAIHKFFFFTRYFSCSWRIKKIAFVLLLTLRAINQNCLLSIYAIFHPPFNHSF